MRKAVFICKEGALVENDAPSSEPSLIRLKPFAVDALKVLQASGYTIIVVSEQPDVAHGLPEQTIERMRQYLEALLMMFNIRINGFYYCPHDPAGTVAAYKRKCECRKPGAGLLLRAAHEHQIDLNASWLIGTTDRDLEMARNAGCRAVMLSEEVDDYGDEVVSAANFEGADCVVEDLRSAAEHIISPQQSIEPEFFAKAS